MSVSWTETRYIQTRSQLINLLEKLTPRRAVKRAIHEGEVYNFGLFAGPKFILRVTSRWGKVWFFAVFCQENTWHVAEYTMDYDRLHEEFGRYIGGTDEARRGDSFPAHPIYQLSQSDSTTDPACKDQTINP